MNDPNHAMRMLQSGSNPDGNDDWRIINPVVWFVGQQPDLPGGKLRNRSLSKIARAALQLSAEFSSVRLDHLLQATSGAPLPSEGVHWSVSHCAQYVAAVAAPGPVGIDIEEIQPIDPVITEQIASPEEWRLSPKQELVDILSYWTAKEAVLKALGIGLAGLHTCKVTGYEPPSHAIVEYQQHRWQVVFHVYPARFIVALTAHHPVDWHVSFDLGHYLHG